MSLETFPGTGEMTEYIRQMPPFWAASCRNLRNQGYGFLDYSNPFRHRPFLILPLIVQPRIKCYRKSRQAGVSENAVTETLWALDNFPMNIVYTFPSPRQVEDFSNTRMKIAIEESKYLSELAGDVMNVGLKQLGKGFLFMRSATSEKLAEGINVDVACFDEIDRMPNKIKIAFQESLSASKWGWVREISTPTLPGRGVDETWQKSTQHVWHVQCEACGEWQPLKYPDNLIAINEVPIHEKVIPSGSYEYCCSKCRQPRINRMDGIWVPNHPSRDIYGFHINQLMCFESGTPILMADGTAKSIEEIDVGDSVMTHRGRYRSVTNIMKRRADQLLKVHTAIGVHTWVTSGHPYLVCRLEKHTTYSYLKFKPEEVPAKWIAAKELRSGDWLCYPKYQPKSIPKNVDCDLHTAKVIGLYAAEGWCRKNEFGFAFHVDEIDLHKTVADWLSDRKITFRITTRKDTKTLSITASSKHYADYFRLLCDTGALSKRVPAWTFDLSEAKRRAVLEGLMKGDGGWYHYKSGKTVVTFTSISMHLVYSVQRLLAQEDIYAGVTVTRYRDKKRCNHRSDSTKWQDRYSISICQADAVDHLRGILNWSEIEKPTKSGRSRWRVGKDCLYVRVTGIEEKNQEVEVYNFEVEDDHSYVANSVVVHNCAWISADQIEEKKRGYRFVQLFYNYVLGEVHSEGGQLLTLDLLERCFNPDLRRISSRSRDCAKVLVGIDWGDINYVTVLGVKPSGVPFLIGLHVVPDTEEPLGSTKEIVNQILPYDPDAIVADLGYGKDRVAYLIEKFPGRVFACSYLDDAKTVLPSFSETTAKVTVDRTACLKSATNRIREQQIQFPTYDYQPYLNVFFKHLTNLYRLLEENDDGKIIERIDYTGDGDHFAHALGYALLGLDYVGVGGAFAFDFI